MLKTACPGGVGGVGGEIRSPPPDPEGRPLGVYEAILMSGGLGRFGDAKKVHIMRVGKGG